MCGTAPCEACEARRPVAKNRYDFMCVCACVTAQWEGEEDMFVSRFHNASVLHVQIKDGKRDALQHGCKIRLSLIKNQNSKKYVLLK